MVNSDYKFLYEQGFEDWEIKRILQSGMIVNRDLVSAIKANQFYKEFNQKMGG